jgi:hypothetical protein
MLLGSKKLPEVQVDTVKTIKNYLYYQYGISFIAVCCCGALSFETDEGSSYSVMPENARFYFPDLPSCFFNELTRQVPSYVCCNHCINHWGLDLCACGSAEAVSDCTCGSAECGRPAQRLEAII